jgi:hypothetical protein
MRKLLCSLGVVCLCALPAAAQDTNELLNRLKAMEERIQSLEAEVLALKGQSPAQAPAVREAPAPASAVVAPELVLGGAGAAASKALNPDVSVIGDFVGMAGNGASRPGKSLEMHESEVGLQEVIDPYARADFFLTFGETGVGLEEGYLTFTSLPFGLQVKAGKMRAAFGKVNTMHNHTLDWVDRPLMTQNLVGGEDGINDAGVSLSRILPAPKGLFLEGTAQLFRGDSDAIFTATRRNDLATVEHLRAYRDFNDATNLDLGLSYARGHSPYADGNNQLYGLDATLRWKPLQRAIYRSFMARGEAVWARTAVNGSTSLGASANPLIANPFGFYVSGSYQFRQRWTLGARYDRSERGACLDTVPATTTVCDASLAPTTLLRDSGASLLITYRPSEFTSIRTQFRRSAYGDGRKTNEVLLQLILAMGAHGAHPF